VAATTVSCRPKGRFENAVLHQPIRPGAKTYIEWIVEKGRRVKIGVTTEPLASNEIDGPMP
jgi:hypothetical protein